MDLDRRPRHSQIVRRATAVRNQGRKFDTIVNPQAVRRGDARIFSVETAPSIAASIFTHSAFGVLTWNFDSRANPVV
ncbi:MAG: hypothetical protein ACREQN_00930 [Candidatus Binataceae bacterium]